MPGFFDRRRNLLASASENLARNARVYGVAAAGLVAGLTPLLSGLAIAEGLKAESLAGVHSGADVYCTWDQFGRDTGVHRDRLPELAGVPGVVRSVPRIIGRLNLLDEVPILVGIPFEELRAHPPELRGALPASEADVLIGHELARATGLSVGSRITLEDEAVRVFQISGIVSSTSSLWSTKAVVCAIEEAALVFGQPEHVSDVCLYTRPGYEAWVAEAVERLDSRFRVQTKDLVRAYVFRGMTQREGAFTALFALALALAIPSFATLTFLGQRPRRREIGLLKAEGWSTSEVLEMVSYENLLVALISAGSALLLAAIWVRLLRAPLIASFFLAELPLFPDQRIPVQFAPLPVLLSVLFSLVVCMTGSIVTTWRTATTAPAEALR